MPFLILAGNQEKNLIKRISDYKIYSVKLNYKRHIVSYKVYKDFYFRNMLNYIFQNQDVFKESSLVKAEGDYKVYLIDEIGNRHWLNMTAERFLDLGYSFSQVFEISKDELLSYKESYQIK